MMSAEDSARAMGVVRNPLRLAPMTNAERMYALDEAWLFFDNGSFLQQIGLA